MAFSRGIIAINTNKIRGIIAINHKKNKRKIAIYTVFLS